MLVEWRYVYIGPIQERENDILIIGKLTTFRSEIRYWTFSDSIIKQIPILDRELEQRGASKLDIYI